MIGKLVGLAEVIKQVDGEFLLILRTLITILCHPTSIPHLCLTACRHQQDYALDLWPCEVAGLT